MAYRKYNRRGSGRRRSYSRGAHEQPGLVDAVLNLTAASIALLARGIWWLVRAGWQNRPGADRAAVPPTMNRPYAAQPPLPPPLPYAARPPIGPLAVVRAPAPGRGVESPTETLPYRRTSCLLSKGERALWYPLYRAVKGQYRLFCKVRLADVVCCPRERRDERRWFRKIGRYHVDFVICEPGTTAPLLVVELDDRRHRARRRQEIDAFKDDVLRAAGVPVYRIAAQQAYDPVELTQNVKRLIRSAVR
jgi:hypothetical protein